MNIKLLYIEDDLIDQQAFERLVQKQNLSYEYNMSSGVAEAKALLEENTYDIIISDFQLGDGTAFDLIDHFGDIPFILVTGLGNEEIAVRAMKAGACDYLIKDSDRNYLIILPMTVENALRHDKEKKQFQMLSHALMDIKDSVFFTDLDDKIIYVNDAFCRSYGYFEEEIIGRDAVVLWDKDIENEYQQSIFPKALRGGLKGEFLHRRQDGNLFPVLLSRAVIKDNRKKPIAIAGIVRDITERKLIEQQFQSLSHFDSLTSLPNRAYMIEKLSQSLVQARWNNYTLALLFIDLDHFKKINDTLGHDAGEKMLKEVASRLVECVRDSDTVARMGGDEFMIILPKITKAQDAAVIAQRVLQSFDASFALDGHDCTIGASIGISQFPSDGDDYETLIKNADIAMYKAKEAGGKNYQFYNSAMNIAAFQQLILENKLRLAVENKEFILHYQPLISLKDFTIVGMEALVRWNDPESQDLIYSDQFIPLAEETGLIIPIGEWILEEACRQAMQWQEAGFPSMKMSVNISGRQFRQHNMVEQVAEKLRITKVDATSLELELTESILLQTEVTTKVLNDINSLGIQLSIDDFGKGYSSLSYLKKLPIRKLKIDQTFVEGITRDVSDREIIKAIISMSHSLNIRVLAEGVETKEQLKFLKESDCDEAQGYLFCPPQPAEDLEKLLSKTERTVFAPLPDGNI
ncbi:MAG: EAL domain-containing protein [Candidatus Aminicenantes bacterium]|nr:EAL domain-containing protein [Candidatus Aminicenantes bacterium]